MSIFPQSTVDRILEAIEPDEILRRINYRPEMIQVVDDRIKAFCPIHKETIFRTLILKRRRKTYRCSNYNCAGNKGGDLIDLYARSMNVSYEQALMELASAHHVELDMSQIEDHLKNALEVARNYLELGALGDAEETFKRVLRFKADCLEALEGLIQVFERESRMADLCKARLQLAHSLADRAEYTRAIDLLARQAVEDPTDYDTRLFYIDTLKRGDRTDLAAREAVRLGEDFAKRGEVDRALEMLRWVQHGGLGGPDVTRRVVELLIGAGRREEAVAEYVAEAERRTKEVEYEAAATAIEAAIELEPGNDQLYVQLARLVAEAHLDGEHLERVCLLIESLLLNKIHGPAGVALDALSDAFPESIRIMALRADLEEGRGDEAFALDLRLRCVDLYQNARQYADALQVLHKTMVGREENVTLLSRKANLLRDMGRIRESLTVYTQIVDIFRNDEELENAAAVYQTIIDLEPEDFSHRERQFEIYLQLGMEPLIVQKATALAGALEHGGEINRAADLLDRALRHAPESCELLIQQAELFDRAGRRGEAAELFHGAGRALLKQDDAERARQMLERALRCVPEHLEARETLADALARQGQTVQAAAIYADLGEFFLREGDPEATIRLAGKVLKGRPDDVATVLLLVKAYKKVGRVEEQLDAQTQLARLYLDGQSYTLATEVCEEILGRQPDYAPALEQLVRIAEATQKANQSVKYLWKLSQVHARAGRREHEQEILQQILQREPMHAQAWFRHLELLALWGQGDELKAAVEVFAERFGRAERYDEALRILDDVTQCPEPRPVLFAGIAALHRRADHRDGLMTALRTQAEMLGRLGRDREALEVWDELANLQDENQAIIRTRIEIMRRNQLLEELVDEYRRLARTLIAQKLFAEAQVALREVLALDPNDAETRDTLISVLVDNRDYRRAIEEIDEAAAQQLDGDQPENAIQIYERVFEFDPARVETHRRIISIRRRMGDLTGAVACYNRLLDALEEEQSWEDFEQTIEEAIEAQPDNWTLRHRLANYYERLERPDDAERVLLSLAMTQAEAEQLDDSEQTLVRLLEINPHSVPGRAHHAELMARRGRTEAALSEFLSLTGTLTTAQVMLSPAAAAEHRYFKRGNYEGLKLINEYTFDTFIVGGRNNFAQATALAVSRAPAKNYNPLFLYSDVGLGKTHLCHAITHAILDRHHDLRVLYTTTEEFVNELIDAIRTNRVSDVRTRHKMTDVLIIDDVQFLSGKERAQEEFFHIFNTLFQSGKQIVLTSDRPPKDINRLEKRLKSRFGAGIIVDIQPPDFETRVAIIRHELRLRRQEQLMTDEVIMFVAERVESNVRELKGRLTQLLARHDLGGEAIDIDVAEEIVAQADA